MKRKFRVVAMFLEGELYDSLRLHARLNGLTLSGAARDLVARGLDSPSKAGLAPPPPKGYT